MARYGGKGPKNTPENYKNILFLLGLWFQTQPMNEKYANLKNCSLHLPFQG